MPTAPDSTPRSAANQSNVSTDSISDFWLCKPSSQTKLSQSTQPKILGLDSGPNARPARFQPDIHPDSSATGAIRLTFATESRLKLVAAKSLPTLDLEPSPLNTVESAHACASPLSRSGLFEPALGEERGQDGPRCKGNSS